MIRNDRGDHFLLITQHDHAVLAGQLAARLGQRPVRRARPAAGRRCSGSNCTTPAGRCTTTTPTLNKDGAAAARAGDRRASWRRRVWRESARAGGRAGPVRRAARQPARVHPVGAGRQPEADDRTSGSSGGRSCSSSTSSSRTRSSGRSSSASGSASGPTARCSSGWPTPASTARRTGCGSTSPGCGRWTRSASTPAPASRCSTSRRRSTRGSGRRRSSWRWPTRRRTW